MSITIDIQQVLDDYFQNRDGSQPPIEPVLNAGLQLLAAIAEALESIDASLTRIQVDGIEVSR